MDNDFKKRMQEFMKATPKNKSIKNSKDVRHASKNIKNWLKNG